MATPRYIMNFIRAICPESPELYMAMFDEKKALIDATEIIDELRKENDRLRSEITELAVKLPWGDNAN